MSNWWKLNFIEKCENIPFFQNSIISPNPNSKIPSVQAGETIEFEIKISQKGPEARRVTGVNGGPVIGSLQDPSIKANMTKDLLISHSTDHRENWSVHSKSRRSSVVSNFGRGFRKRRQGALSASASIRGSRHSINERPASSERRGNRYKGDHRNRGTLSSDRRDFGSRRSLLDYTSPSDSQTLYNHGYNYSTNMYSSYQFASTQPSSSDPYYNYNSETQKTNFMFSS